MRKLIVAAALALPALCLAQASDEIARPEVKVGDRWSYRTVDPWTRRENGGFATSVVNVTPRAIQTVTTRRGSDKELDETWTPEWNALNTAQGEIYDPDDAALKFPLRPGMTWPVAYQLRRTGMDVYHRAVSAKATVVGWEDVQVPAGKFRAMKVTIEGRLERTGYTFKISTSIWYVPQVKRWVKLVWEGWSTTGGSQLADGWHHELVDYKVQ